MSYDFSNIVDPRRRSLSAAAAIFLVALPAAGCAHGDAETTVANPYEHGMTFAVAPVLNFSGELNFDPVKAADLLASELTYVEDANVLPVSRVVAYLASQGRQQIESPAHALNVAEAVGADAIWIAGITEYDPYTPVVGLAIQIYTLAPQGEMGVDPIRAERMAQPMSVASMADATLPRGQLQMVYNGTHSGVADAVRSYAEPRNENAGPLGWREYLKVQTLFLRFCWHDAVYRMMTQERWRQCTDPHDDEQAARTPHNEQENAT